MEIELSQGEKIVEIIRKSPYKVVIRFFKVLFLTIPAILVIIYFNSPFLIIIVFIWLIILLTYILNIWLVWYYNVYILTNKKIVKIHHETLFKKEVIEVPLEKIRDVSFSIEGIKDAIFGNGTVKIISDGFNIDLEEIKNPEITRRLILELKGEK